MKEDGLEKFLSDESPSSFNLHHTLDAHNLTGHGHGHGSGYVYGHSSYHVPQRMNSHAHTHLNNLTDHGNGNGNVYGHSSYHMPQRMNGHGHNQLNSLVDHGSGYGYDNGSMYMPQRVNGHGHGHGRGRGQGDGHGNGMYDEHRVSLPYDTSLQSFFSGGLPLLPHREEPKPQLINGPESWLDNSNHLLDSLTRDFSKMYVTNEQEGVQYRSPSLLSTPKYGASDYRGFNNISAPRGHKNFQGDPLMGMMHHDQRSERSSFVYRTNGLANNNFGESLFSREFGDSVSLPQFQRTPGFDVSSYYDTFLHTPKNGVSLNDAFTNVVHMSNPMSHYNQEKLHRKKVGSTIEAFMREDSVIIQGEGIDNKMNVGQGRSRGVGTINPKNLSQFSIPLNSNSLTEVHEGEIYQLAKDQRGCRALQKLFDEGSPQEMQMIFNEIIDHVVELMMNPFGNYLMQKLLEKCNEDQRMQIVQSVTRKPGELIRISLNVHGTRVVQKMVETLNSRHQRLLVISALEPGFVALMKDLNGNHVVQKCLHSFSPQDSEFIFVAAAKYNVDIAMHQHGCVVLQHCISYSDGEFKKNLVTAISENGLILAQDPYGNFVVQFVLETKIQSAVARLTSQFEGRYVQLSRQKFSSHVVEKCLIVCNDDVRTTIIHELLSVPCFEQFLQDPHANYVLQRALDHSKGLPINKPLVDAIEPYKTVLRNSPYCKKMLSHKLLKR